MSSIYSQSLGVRAVAVKPKMNSLVECALNSTIVPQEEARESGNSQITYYSVLWVGYLQSARYGTDKLVTCDMKFL